jgi:hypothetical protein
MNEEEIPPVRKLDFSGFHPLDHRIGSRYCREVDNFPTAPKGWGNIPRHAKLWWEYQCQWRPKLLWHWVLCHIFHHHVIRGGETIMMMGNPMTVTRCCIYCYRPPADGEH